MEIAKRIQKFMVVLKIILSAYKLNFENIMSY